MKYAAFLRGLNLGSTHRVSNDELRAHFAAIGLRDVRTFRSSGNVSFETGDEPEEELAARIEARLGSSLGYGVATILRSEPELRAIAALQPFDARDVSASAGKLQVSLLPERPHARVRAQVLEHATERDRLAFGERELYWLPSGPMLDSELDVDAVERLLGVSTRRTKDTIELIAAKHFAVASS